MRIALLLYPLLELWSLIELGAQTSAGLAVLWVLAAGFLGMTTIRFAGAQVLSRLQAAQREGVLQQQLVASDMALAVAGLLLIIPGLLSDAMAVLVLIALSGICWVVRSPRGGQKAVTVMLPAVQKMARGVTRTMAFIRIPSMADRRATVAALGMTG